jgi:UDP-N-acetylglucosamine 4,6-dehydratase
VLNKSSILVTGGTGSFGQTFIPMTMLRYNPHRLVVYSRDEIKQWEMMQKYLNDPRVEFIIGDVRDKERLTAALAGIDFVVHAAATKIVPTAEYNPFECIKTNINGAMNIIEASVKQRVKRVVALSTDKASNPINLYGATKLASDKMFVSANARREQNCTQFSVVRYGNVMGSRGSVIPHFMLQAQRGELTITDERMTRFMITLEEAAELVWHAFDDMIGGEIYVKKIPSMKITDIARAVAPDANIRIIGIRPGEKIHEQMIGHEDASHTFSYEGHYKILPMIHNWSTDPTRIKDGCRVREDFTYTSENNLEWMEIETLRQWIHGMRTKIGII